MTIVGKEYLPNVYFENIEYAFLDATLTINFNVTMFDNIERTWSQDDKFIKYLSVAVIVETGTTTIQRMTDGENLFFKRFNDLDSQRKISVPFLDVYEGSGLVVRLSEGRRRKYTKRLSIRIDNISSERIFSLFGCSFIDLETLKQNEEIDISHVMGVPSYCGSIASEKINAKMFLFKNSDERYYAGPVHLHEDKFMEGSKHEERPHQVLTLEEFPNTKITEIQYPQIGSLEVEGPNAILQQAAPSGESFFLPTQISPNNWMADVVRDFDNNINFNVIVDLQRFILDESRTAQTLLQNNAELFSQVTSNADMGNVNVYRSNQSPASFLNRLNMPINQGNYQQREMVAQSHNNRKKVRQKTLYRVDNRQLISVDPQTILEKNKRSFFNGKEITKALINSSQRIGKIDQLNLTLPKNFRPISITDYEIANKKGGEFYYSIEISTKDPVLEFMDNLLKRLLKSFKRLEDFNGFLMMKNAHNGVEYKTEFLVPYYGQYGMVIDPETRRVTSIDKEELRKNFIFEALESLKFAEASLGQQSRSDFVRASFNLFRTTPSKMDAALKYYQNVIDSFKRTYDLEVDKGSKKSSVRSAAGSRSQIQTVIKVKDPVINPVIQKIGYNFFSQTKHEGMFKITRQDFISRANREVSKFFKKAPTTADENIVSLSGEEKQLFVDINRNKYVNFTPTKFFFGSREISTDKIDAESLDVDFFNNFKIVKNAVKDGARSLRQSSEESSPFEIFKNLKDKTEDEKFLDSREFLGSVTKFNRLILSALNAKAPEKIFKIRKSFKFLDKKMLKKEKKPISLDTFDLKLPSSPILQKIKREPADVPIQIKALSLLKSNATTFDVESLGFDPIKNPETNEVVKQNYLNIGKTEMLVGFEKLNGIYDMNRPIWKEITDKNFKDMEDKNVFCRLVKRNYENLDQEDEFEVFDKTFVLIGTDKDNMSEE